MFKFFKRIFLFCTIVMLIVCGSLVYINYKIQSNLKESFSTVYNQGNKENKESKKDESKKDVEIKSNPEISKEISDILSNDASYDLAIKCDDISALVSIDSNTKETNIKELSVEDNFNDVSSKSDKYISLDNYTLDEIKELKDKLSSGSFSERYNIVKDVLNNADTNIRESDLIDIYFKYMAQK